jgi:transcriptional regulator with XRE-family HTH domain
MVVQYGGSVAMTTRTDRESPMSLATRLRQERKRAGLKLDQLSERAGISKTYLWELENDKEGTKKPSAAVLLRLAEALSLTIADLMGLPSIRVDDSNINVPQSLMEFQEMMAQMGQAVTDQDVHDLATMRFRGGQPRTKEAWYQLYVTLKHTTEP